MSDVVRYTFDFSERLQKDERIQAVWFYTSMPIVAVSHYSKEATLYAQPEGFTPTFIQCDVWTSLSGPSSLSITASTDSFS